MQTHKVDASQWPGCLSQFSRAHHGQDVSIETLTPDIGIRSNVRRIPLLGITMDSDAPHVTSMTVEAGDTERGLFTHTIANPVEIRTAEWNDGVSLMLEIETKDGVITRVQVGPLEQTLPSGLVADDFWKRE